MGRFSVNVELCNYNDLANAAAGFIGKDEVRRTTLPGVVDTGAVRLVIPESVSRALGLRETGKVRVRYADRRSALRPLVGGLYLGYSGRDGVFDAIVEPKRDTALIGAIVLETLDFVVDPTHQKLVPRDPKYPIAEIE